MDQIYADIAARTGGNIYVGVVGPVRTGKSTLIKRIMERNCECRRIPLICELFYFWNQSASGKRNVSLTYVETIFIINKLQKFGDIVIVVKWLSTSHQNNICNFSLVTKLTTNMAIDHDNLSQNLTCRQVSYESVSC